MMAESTTSSSSVASPSLPVPSLAWADSALILTAIVAALAKVAGVLIVPGMRGVASQAAIDNVELASSTLSYATLALFVALAATGSFLLAREARVGLGTRATVIALTGLELALASPAAVSRLHTLATLMLAIMTSLLALVAAAGSMRTPHTRMLAVVMTTLAASGLMRPVSWEMTAFAADRANVTLFQAGYVLAGAAVVAFALATLLAAAWIGTRSPWRGRLLANVAIGLALALTYLAARETNGERSAFEAILRASLLHATAGALPSTLITIAAFLQPASILLALVVLLQKAPPPAVKAVFAFALLSGGGFDVPLQAMAIAAASVWLLLATANPHAMWVALAREREEGNRS